MTPIERLAKAGAPKRKTGMQIPKVPKPQPVREEAVEIDQGEDEDYSYRMSMRYEIQNLLVGDSYARAKRFDGDDVTKQQLEATHRNMRYSVQPTVFRINKRTGQEYTIEGIEGRTQSRDIIIVIVVTRTA